MASYVYVFVKYSLQKYLIIDTKHNILLIIVSMLLKFRPK